MPDSPPALPGSIPPPIPKKPAATDPLILGLSGRVIAIDSGSGRTLWSTDLTINGLVGKSRPRGSTTVMLAEKKIYAGAAGNLYCLDAVTGKILWHNPLSGMGYGDVAMAMNGIAVQYVTRVVTQS